MGINKISQEKCIPCRRGAPLLTQEEIDVLLPQIDKWILIKENSIQLLKKSFQTSDFSETMHLADKIFELAEKQGHHPKIVVEWGNLEIQWWTHKIRGLHRNDFIMAAKTDQIIKEFASL